jgi:CheY-like chemotaxis protein
MNESASKEKKSLDVLWVDDDFIIAESARILVESIGHKCTLVMSGYDALEHLKENNCDIVFTDIGMPEMNGWELAEAIQIKFEKKIKIIAVTGWDIDQKVKEEQSIDMVLQKPFTLAKLKKLFLDL